MDEKEVNKWNDLNKEEVTVKISCNTVVEDVADRDTVIEEVTECMRTPRPTLYEQNETPGGSIYWKPHVEGIPIPVEGTYYDTIDEALDMYTKYVEMAGFEVKKGGQRFINGMGNQFIGESDAQMLINKMENRKKYAPNFTFQYKVENSELVAMFWADEVAKCNYKEFGDIVSFDATFNNNKISEIQFESFRESYVILLESHVILLFSQVISLESQMIHVESQVIRIESHVISLESHICKEIYNETDFKERFDKIVWNMFIEPLEFEEKWAQLIEDFGLQSHKWLKKMFNLREIWIPAYFIDSPLYGLMRTTSRSESENSFFKSFTSPGATLVSFMMSYESAMERQRYRQESLDFKTIDAAPKCITQLDIELHAARVYTRTMFLIVQTEINEGCWNCTIQGLNIDEGCETVIIRDKKPNENKSLFHKKRKKREKNKRRKLEQWEKQRKTIR
ncbi:FAR1-related sequence 5-like protein [Tanacetum coccineum]